MSAASAAAERAFRLLLVRTQWTSGDSKVDECAVRDMLADLRHYCDEQGIDYYNEDRIAHDNYSAERLDADEE